MNKIVIAAIFLASGTSAFAFTEAERAFLAEQEKMQRELQSLNMQVRVLEQRAKVADLERKISGNPSPAAGPMGLPGFPPPGVPFFGDKFPGGPLVDLRKTGVPGAPGGLGAPDMPPPEPEIRLMSVFGAEKNLQADILVSGTRTRASRGDVVGDGWSVRAIEPTGVVLTKGKQTRRIGF